jgi:excisionase family DNA binding protein
MSTLNVRETARVLGVHPNTVRNWADKGILKGFRLPGSGFRRFSREEIERMRSEMLNSTAPMVEQPEAGEDTSGWEKLEDWY